MAEELPELESECRCGSYVLYSEGERHAKCFACGDYLPRPYRGVACVVVEDIPAEKLWTGAAPFFSP